MLKLDLNFLHLADAATVDAVGKVSILGIFERIFFKKKPGKILKFTVVGNIDFSGKIDKPVNIEIKFFDSKKKELKTKNPFSFNLNVPESKKEGKLGFVADIINLTFKEFGKHSLVVYVDKKELGKKEFIVEKKQ